jgi:CubicO group peptidase (beta-lactamase class C family)
VISPLLFITTIFTAITAITVDMHTHHHHHIDAGFRPDRDVVSDLRDSERERSDRVTSTLSMLSMASSGSLTRGATPPLAGSTGGVALGLAGYSLGGTLSVPASGGLYGHALLQQQQAQLQQSLSQTQQQQQQQKQKQQQRRGSGSAIGYTSTWGTSAATSSAPGSSGAGSSTGSSTTAAAGTAGATGGSGSGSGVDDDDSATSLVLATTDKVTCLLQSVEVFDV